MAENSDLQVIAFNCSLKSADEAKETSSTEKLVNQLLEEFKKHGAAGTIVRAVDHDIKPGVTSDEGDGDAWPALREQIIEADILVMATPIWLGQPSSVAKRVMERIDAFPPTKAVTIYPPAGLEGRQCAAVLRKLRIAFRSR
jgi:multimeric flavodoxin WrbA